jgi:hypothetical protein
MVKASLRSSTKPANAVVIDANPVEVEGVKVESKTTIGASQDALENIIPDGDSQPPTDQAQGPGKPEPSLPVARRGTNTAVAQASSQFEGSGFEGDWGAEDLKFPQLKIVQGSGPLSAQFDNGTIIYGDNELLPAPSMKQGAANPSIRFIPLSIKKQFREKLSEDQVAQGEMPRIVDTVAQVEESGGTTRWIGNSMPDNYWEPSARCMFLIEKPESSDHPGFALELGGKLYGVAVYYAAGGSFRDSAKIIFNTALTSLLVPVLGEDNKPKLSPTGQIVKKPLLYKNFWTLNFAKKQAGNFTPWRPIVKLLAKEESSPEVRAYCASLVASPVEAAAEAE